MIKTVFTKKALVCKVIGHNIYKSEQSNSDWCLRCGVYTECKVNYSKPNVLLVLNSKTGEYVRGYILNDGLLESGFPKLEYGETFVFLRATESNGKYPFELKEIESD